MKTRVLSLLAIALLVWAPTLEAGYYRLTTADFARGDCEYFKAASGMPTSCEDLYRGLENAQYHYGGSDYCAGCKEQMLERYREAGLPAAK